MDALQKFERFIILLFPGQGAQQVGMGKELSLAFTEAKELFEEVDDALSYRLSSLMFDGEQEQLNLTIHAQPAIFAVSLAVLKVLERQTGLSIDKIAKASAGHSLGEYSALTAAGTFVVGDAIRVLKSRAEAMQKAAPIGRGGMVAVLDTDVEIVQRMIDEIDDIGVCEIANDNGAGQVVLSCELHLIERILDRTAKYGIRKAIRLPVTGPFHSSLMLPAARDMDLVLSQVEMYIPKIPVHSNVSTKGYHTLEEVRALLVQQIHSKVRWRETMELFVKMEPTHFIEIGPGRILTNIAKKMFPNHNLECINISTPSGVEDFLTKHF
ncbi:[acyl-carrier-protein] S-malonyltransferase [Rickettsiales endosymbiont of Peranema trichophorum]|uniref:ACP S-malonyltransferase n=1 Tax=Rickettsiales endosymbiont of Peranema trichophorum TaxID=2486577 RepID=UPI001022B223|nr:ACP S-malonyltransferase [Rickettsiales endosymbiont of Peranema trichophorum]RZI45586.1 [acyl-carrier-protein] S-malonyltransferase [Rickettsiales endosymbiont of Peranema trichophorum]